MDDAMVVDDWRGLCLFLGGSEDSFTGRLLELVTKADPGNRAKLREAFPREVAAWEEWCAHAPLPWGELDRLTTARMERPWRDDAHLTCDLRVPGADTPEGAGLPTDPASHGTSPTR